MKTKTQLTNRIISLVLTLVMVMSTLPLSSLTAFAADTPTEKNIMLGTSHIEGAQASNVYFGTYKQSKNGNGEYNIDPIKWRVLSNADGKLFLLSDQNLDVFQYHTEYESVTWETSTMRSWLNGLADNKGAGDNAIDYADNNFLDTAFSASEQTAIANTTVVNNSGNNTTDKVFLLSSDEAKNTAYGFPDDDSRQATNTAYVADGGEIGARAMYGVGVNDTWWLRSRGGLSPSNAVIVGRLGPVVPIGNDVNDSTTPVRPAFNINLSSILFTSAAKGGKPQGFNAVEQASGNDWKLTFLDSSRSFAVSDTTAKTVKAGDTFSFEYSGATTGTNEYISAMFVDANGEVVYYGQLVRPTEANGTVDFVVPSDMEGGTYTLKLFNEQINGDCKTDYSSDFVDIQLIVTALPTVSFDANGGTGIMNSVKAMGTYTLPQSDFTASTGYQFKGWATTEDGTVISEATITVTADITLYAIWEMIPAEVPVVTAGSDLVLTYNDYTNQQVSVIVTEQDGYTYSYQWYDGSDQPINGETYSTYTLPDNLTVDSYSYYCKVTAKRSDNQLINSADSAKITVTVNKAPATLTAPATVNSITYGATLSTVGLTGGWIWADGTIVPTVVNTGYMAYYIPADTVHYDWTQVDGWNGTAGRVERTVSVTVNKAAPGVDAPNAKTDLVYNGSEQELISAGSATNGTMQYALGTAETVTGEWKTDIPKARNADTYYVWYRVVGNDNYNDVDPVCITVTVAKVNITVTAEDKSKTYGQADPALTWSITSGALAPNDSLTGISLSRATGEDADQYTITVSQTAGTNPNYDITLVNGTFIIAQKELTPIITGNISKAYDGTPTVPDGLSIALDVIFGTDDVTATAFFAYDGVNVGTTKVSATGITLIGVDAGNYKLTATTASANVGQITQATPAYTVPTGLAATYGDTLADVTLSEGFAWEDALTTAVGNVGDRKFTVTYTPGDTLNYKTVTGIEVIIEVKAAAASVATPPTAIRGLIYDKTAQELITAGIASSGEMQYSLDGVDYSNAIPEAINAGTYTVYYKVVGDSNHYGTEAETLTVAIDKATYDMSNAKWNYTAAFDYNGNEQTVKVIGLPSGVTVSGYEGDKATDVGNYTAKVTFSYDGNNYYEPILADLPWSIVNTWQPTEYTVTDLNGNGWINGDFEITAADGYQISLTNTANGEWKDSLTYSDETDNGSVTFYLKNLDDGTISLKKTVNYKIDTTDPTGEVEFVGREPWQEFVNNITFGLFFKDEVTVKVTANDTLSDIAKIEYASSKEAKTLTEVKEIANWIEYNDSFGVSVEDTKQFVYFIRITDNAGNVFYLSTDGAEYDTTAPVISGVENGETYYTTQKVTVTDKNIESITLNDVAADTDITLVGNKEATYTIIATDKAGNSTTVTVTMKPIKELAKATEDLVSENVTSDHAPALKELVEKLDELIADPDTSEGGEKETLEQHKSGAEDLLKAIEDTKAEIARINEELNKYDGDTVNSDDAEALEQLGKDIKALTDGGNLTDAEREALTKDASEVTAMQKTVTDTIAENDRISDAVDGYDLATVTSDDKADLEQLLADINKQLESTNLTDEEISELNGDKTAVEDLLTKIKGTDELIDKLTEDVDGYNDDTVKSTDKDAIKQIIEDIEALLETENLTEDEKKALEDTKEKAEGLLDTIEDAAKATDTENTEKVKDVTTENVTPENKTDLEKAKEDLEKALEDHGSNMTEDEKKAIEDEIKRIEDALEVIGNVEAVEEAISELPAVDTVKPDDEEAIKVITDAQATYNALSDYEKSLVDGRYQGGFG